MTKPTKLLFIIDSYKNPYAGTEGQLLKLLNSLDKKQFDPMLVVFRRSEYLQSNGFPVPYEALNVTRMASVRTWIILFRYYRKKKHEGFSLAHIYFNDASMVCPPVLKLLGYKVIISRRDMGYWYSKLNLILLRFNSIYVDKVIANSNAVKDLTHKMEWYPRKCIEVIYNGYLESTTYRVKDDSLRNINDRCFKVVLVANIRPIKRIEDALRAIHMLQHRIPGIALYVIGDGDQSPLRALSRELNVCGVVQFLGPRDDVLNLLPTFDVGLLCSESEGFSNTLIEYLQSGLPVVCSDVGGNPEIVEHGVNGLLYDCGDIEKLVDCLIYLSGSRERRVAMGRAGRDKVKSAYSLSSAVKKHENLYQNLIKGI